MRARLDRAASLIIAGSGARDFPWGQLRYEHVVYLRKRLQMEGCSASHVNLTLVALRRVAREARRLGQMELPDAQAICEVEGVRHESLPAGRMLAPKERLSLFRACARDSTPRGRRDACAIALMMGTGLRREECASLDLASLDVSGRQLRLVGKGGREATLPIKAEVAQAVSDWLRVRGRRHGALLLPVSWSGRVREGRLSGQDVYRIIIARSREAGLDHCTPHDLRRTFISELLDSEDTATVQQLARHKNPAVTVRYDRRGERTKRRAVSTLYVPYRRPPTRPRPKRKPGRRRRRRVKRTTL